MFARPPLRLAVASGLLLSAACVSSSLRPEPASIRLQGTERTDGALASVVATHNAAMVARDIAALDTMLAPDLTYTHPTGVVQTKSQLISALRSKTLVYESIVPQSTFVRQYGETAVATGVARLTSRAEGMEVREPVRFTEVYVRRDNRWQLVAYESTTSQ